MVECYGVSFVHLLQRILDPATSDEVAVQVLGSVPDIEGLAVICDNQIEWVSARGRGKRTCAVIMWLGAVARAAAGQPLARPHGLREDVLEVERTILQLTLSGALDKIGENAPAYRSARELVHSRLDDFGEINANNRDKAFGIITSGVRTAVAALDGEPGTSPWIESFLVGWIADSGLIQELLLKYNTAGFGSAELLATARDIWEDEVQARGDGVWLSVQLATVHSLPAVAVSWLLDLVVRLLAFGVVVFDDRFRLVAGRRDPLTWRGVEYPDTRIASSLDAYPELHRGLANAVLSVAERLLAVRSFSYGESWSLVLYASVRLETGMKIIQFLQGIGEPPPTPNVRAKPSADRDGPEPTHRTKRAVLMEQWWSAFGDLPLSTEWRLEKMLSTESDANDNDLTHASAVSADVLEEWDAVQSMAAIRRVADLLASDGEAASRGWTEQALVAVSDDVPLLRAVDRLSRLHPTFHVSRSDAPLPLK